MNHNAAHTHTHKRNCINYEHVLIFYSKWIFISRCIGFWMTVFKQSRSDRMPLIRFLLAASIIIWAERDAHKHTRMKNEKQTMRIKNMQIIWNRQKNRRAVAMVIWSGEDSKDRTANGWIMQNATFPFARMAE